MGSVTGSLFLRPADGAESRPSLGWRAWGSRGTHVLSLDEQFARLRISTLEDTLRPIVDSLPSDADVHLVLWLPVTAAPERVEVGFRAAAISGMGLDSIWLEVDGDSSGTEPDEVRVYDVTDPGRALLIDALVTRDASIRQTWFTEVLASGPHGQRLRIDLCSRGGIVGLVFDRALLAESGARDVHVRVSGVDVGEAR